MRYPNLLTPRALEAARDELRTLPDDHIRAPLWMFVPEVRPLVLHERRRRFGDYNDPPEADPEYS